MSDITLHDLNPDTERELARRATENGCTVEHEAAKILDDAIGNGVDRCSQDLYTKIRAIVDPVGGIELEMPNRSSNRPIPFLGWEE